MEGQISVLILSFLAGYATLWLGWGLSRRPWSRQKVARGFLGLGAGAMVLVGVGQTISCCLEQHLWGWGWYCCFPLTR